jgi:rhodanese-related sulfurtransferase
MVAQRVEVLLERARREIARFTPLHTEALVRAGALLVDIRPEAQRARHGSVPGAICIERNVLEWRLDPQSAFRCPEATDHGRCVIVICQEGYASSFAAASLQALGYERAGDVIGGFEAWRAVGLGVQQA